eukprot:4357464-Amphidinium_carterae.1
MEHSANQPHSIVQFGGCEKLRSETHSSNCRFVHVGLRSKHQKPMQTPKLSDCVLLSMLGSGVSYVIAGELALLLIGLNSFPKWAQKSR